MKQTIKKINILELLNTLNDMYESGIDYADIFIDDKKPNKLGFGVKLEYYMENNNHLSTKEKLKSINPIDIILWQ